MPATRRWRKRQRRPGSPAPSASAPESKLDVVRELCSFEGRLAGTDAERRAANAMAGRLRDMGRRAEIQPVYVHPQAQLVWAAHCALAFAASILSISQPVAAFALALATATSFYLDLNTQRHLLRLLFFRRASQNVVSRGNNPDAPATLILAAHLDTARTGLPFNPRVQRISSRLSSFLPFPHTRLLFWSTAVLLPLLGARAAGVDTDGLAIVQIVPTLFLLVAIYLLLDWRLSAVSPGANDNASGVATALSIARTLEDEPVRDLDVWVVLTGGEECGMEGMRSFTRAHREEFDPFKTIVLAIDAVGAGDPRWIVSEGLTISYEMDFRLGQLAEAIAEADREGGARFRAAPLRRGYAGDALAARVGGLRAGAVTSLEPGAISPPHHHTLGDVPGSIDPEALDRAEGFCLELVRALDRDFARGSRQGRPASSTSAS